MREIKFKNKKANHSINIAGKNIEFKNGVAFVDDNEANFIEGTKDPDYKVVPEKRVEEKPKKKSRKSKKK